MKIADKDGIGISIAGKGADGWSSRLAADVHEGSKVIHLTSTKGLKAGDVLHVSQANTQDFWRSGTYDNVQGNRYAKDNPLRESLVEIQSIQGNRVTLKQAIAHDMDKGEGLAQRYQMLEDVAVSDFTLSYRLGTPDAAIFENKKAGYEGAIGLAVKYTQDLSLSRVTVENSASIATEIRSALDAHVKDYTASGAHNKGGGGNGYGLTLAESFYGTYDDLKFVDMRHGLLFSSWNAEAYNKAHIAYTNRDINFHGGPDHSNSIITDRAVYKPGKDSAWALVSPGSTMHPYTDISKNHVVFAHAIGSSDSEILYGRQDKSYIDGREGHDLLIGGGGHDTLNGGLGNDTLRYVGGTGKLAGGEGNDVMEVRARGEATLYGGNGNDIFRFFGDILTSGVQMSGGAGTDVMRFQAPSNISRADISHVSSIEKIIFHEGLNRLTLDKGVFSGPAVLQGGSEKITLILDSSATGAPVYISRNVNLYLADKSGQEVRLTSSSNGTVTGGSKNDTIYGSSHGDVLYGDDGIDFLYGGDGNDVIVGGGGNDRLWGGRGQDGFFYKDMPDGRDIIYDFNPGQDRLNLDVLFQENGLGAKNRNALIDQGYLRLSQHGDDTYVGVDLDGYAGSRHGTEILAVLENTFKDDVERKIVV